MIQFSSKCFAIASSLLGNVRHSVFLVLGSIKRWEYILLQTEMHVLVLGSSKQGRTAFGQPVWRLHGWETRIRMQGAVADSGSTVRGRERARVLRAFRLLRPRGSIRTRTDLRDNLFVARSCQTPYSLYKRQQRLLKTLFSTTTQPTSPPTCLKGDLFLVTVLSTCHNPASLFLLLLLLSLLFSFFFFFFAKWGCKADRRDKVNLTPGVREENGRIYNMLSGFREQQLGATAAVQHRPFIGNFAWWSSAALTVTSQFILQCTAINIQLDSGGKSLLSLRRYDWAPSLWIVQCRVRRCNKRSKLSTKHDLDVYLSSTSVSF